MQRIPYRGFGQPIEGYYDPQALMKPKSHTGLIIALVIGFIIALSVGGFLLYWFVFRKKKPPKAKESMKFLDQSVQLNSINYDYIPQTFEMRPQLFVELYNAQIPDDIKPYSKVHLNLQQKPLLHPSDADKKYSYMVNRLNNCTFTIKGMYGTRIALESEDFDPMEFGYNINRENVSDVSNEYDIYGNPKNQRFSNENEMSKGSFWGYLVDGSMQYTSDGLEWN